MFKLTDKKRELISRLKRKQGSGIASTTIRARSGSVAPLSFAQQRLWFLDQVEGGNAAYNMPAAFRADGRFDGEALAASIEAVVQRHEVLRTIFRLDAGEPRQIVDGGARPTINQVDLRGLASEAQDERILKLAEEEATRPFDLSSGPLLRVTWVRLAERAQVLLITLHHIVSDGWSISVFVRELAHFYRRAGGADVAPLSTLPIQYADYALWQREQLRGEALERELCYWREQLQGLPPVLALPLDRVRPAVQTFRGTVQCFELDAELTAALNRQSKEERVTLFMTLFAAYAVLLYRNSGQDDIAIGVPVANRNRRETEGLIGFFINTLVMRVDAAGDPSFSELLQRVRRIAMDAYAHQDTPFEKVVEALAPKRDLSYTPLFQVMFILQNAANESLVLPELRLTPIESQQRLAKFDITLTLEEQGNVLRGAWEYNADLFDASTVEHMVRHYTTLLREVLRAPQRSITALPLLSDAEQHELLYRWNDTAMVATQPACLHQLFEAQATRDPHSTALIFDDRSLSYGELNDRANRLALHLRDHGVGPETLVGICLERSLVMVVGLMAILKAGGAYVPLDPAYPEERLSYMLEDARIRVLLTDSAVQERTGLTAPSVVHLDHLPDGPAVTNLDVPVHARNLAYVIYTSGSTGRPKGAMNQHHAVINRLLWMQNHFKLDKDDRVLQKTPISFDVSVWEFFWPLAVGAQLVLAAPGRHGDNQYLLETINKNDISTLHFVPSMLQIFVDTPGVDSARGLKNIVCSGEVLSAALAQRCLSKLPARLSNLYGPTEAAIDVTWWDCRLEGDDAVVPIGRPISNLAVYVLDPLLNPAPIGVAGELYIAGIGVGRGYWQRPGMTAERFLPNLWGRTPGERMYRTGDLARLRPDGTLEYLGRTDHQVKLRGLRIELGEVEAALAQHPAVREVVVTAPDTGPRGRELVAYVVGNREDIPDASALRCYVRTCLPDYMVPAQVMVLDHLPLTPNGKVDRAALPTPVYSPAAGSATEGGAARNATQELICGVWSELLGVEQIGIQDNFFDLGGHSLLATQVVSRVRELFNVEIPLKSFITRPRVEDLAEMVEQQAQTGDETVPLVLRERASEVPMSFAQQRLWFIDQMECGNAAYNMPAAFQMDGRLDGEGLVASIEAIVQRHEGLRTVFRFEEGEARQIIDGGVRPAIDQVDLRGLPPALRDDLIPGLVEEEALRPFDLSGGPLLRVTWIRLTEQVHVLLVTMHHIISDGWSIGVFVRELVHYYRRAGGADLAALTPLPVQYADYALWQREQLCETALERDLGYWREQLQGLTPVLALPHDRSRPAVQTFRGAVQSFELDTELAAALKHLSRKEGVTLFMTLFTAYAVLLHRYSGQDDFAIGVPIANRNRRETEGLIGFFVNTLIMRVNTAGDPGFAELLQRVRRTALDAYAHQDTPFEKVVEALAPERDMSHSSLFQVTFAFQNVPRVQLAIDDLNIKSISQGQGSARFDIELHLWEEGDSMSGYFAYQRALFNPETIELFSRQFVALLGEVSADHSKRISDYSLSSAFEQDAADIENDFAWDVGDNLSETELDALLGSLLDAQSMGDR